MEQTISIRDYIRVLVKWRRLIILNTFIVTVIAIVISLIIPKKYTSRASLLPPLPGTGFLEATGLSSTLAGFAGITGMLAATPSDLFAAILESRAVMEKVIEEYDLMKVYKTRSMEKACAELSENTEISVMPEQIITIAVTSRKPILARDIAESYIRNLDNINRNLVMSTGKKNRVFLEKRLEEVEYNLKIAEDSLKRFQELHKTISIEAEIEPMLEGISEIKAQIIADEIKLGVLEKYATEKNPEIIRIKSEIKELNKKLSSIEKIGDSDHFGLGFSIPFQKLPSVSLEFARLIREVMIQEKLLALLVEKYELAKAQEVKDTPTIDILELPAIPEKKSYPKRTLIVVVAFLISLVLGTLLAFSLNWIENLKPEEREKWKEIRALLRKN